jgi:hypothetical protein
VFQKNSNHTNFLWLHYDGHFFNSLPTTLVFP